MSKFFQYLSAQFANTHAAMARTETETPRSSKRRKLDDAAKSSPLRTASARKRSSREEEMDLYDDFDGALGAKSTPRRNGTRGVLDKSARAKGKGVRAEEAEEKVDEDANEVQATPSRRRGKVKANGSLRSSVRKSKSTEAAKIAMQEEENGDEDDEMNADESASLVKPSSKGKRGRPRKQTIYDKVDGDTLMEETRAGTKSTGKRRRGLGQEEIAETPAKSQKMSREAVEDVTDELYEEAAPAETPSRGQKQKRQQRQRDIASEEPEPMDLVLVEMRHQSISSHKIASKTSSAAIQLQPTNEFTLLKTIVLSKLTQRRPVPLTNLDTEYAKVHQLLEATVSSGESNSMLLIGARGSGKTALINKALLELSRSQKEHFHVVRLNGFIQTDDKLALREIWRQLGREMEIEDDEESMGKSYADTLSMLLALLSHPDEITGQRGDQTAKSVLFIMDEFDLFATHPRQTLLYNLLDIAQSRKAPIAVLGLTTRIDVTEALEKRVKSRFSHRYVHLNLARTLGEFVDAAKAAIKVSPEELGFEEKAVLVGSEKAVGKKGEGGKEDLLGSWNDAVDSLFASTTFQRSIIHPPYHTSKSLPTLFSSLLIPVSFLATNPTPSYFLSTSMLLTPPSSNLHILPSLSNLALSLLISAARLSIIHNTTTTNFPLAYAEYVNLASKARINANAAGQLATGSGMRVYGKEVAKREWEGLVRLGLCVRVGGGAFGAGTGMGGGAGGREMVRIDVALEEIPLQVELGMIMEKWCKQI